MRRRALTLGTDQDEAEHDIRSWAPRDSNPEPAD